MLFLFLLPVISLGTDLAPSRLFLIWCIQNFIFAATVLLNLNYHSHFLTWSFNFEKWWIASAILALCGDKLWICVTRPITMNSVLFFYHGSWNFVRNGARLFLIVIDCSEHRSWSLLMMGFLGVGGKSTYQYWRILVVSSAKFERRCINWVVKEKSASSSGTTIFYIVWRGIDQGVSFSVGYYLVIRMILAFKLFQQVRVEDLDFQGLDLLRLDIGLFLNGWVIIALPSIVERFRWGIRARIGSFKLFLNSHDQKVFIELEW